MHSCSIATRSRHNMASVVLRAAVHFLMLGVLLHTALGQTTPLTSSNTMPGQVGPSVSTPRLVNYSGNTSFLTGRPKNGVYGFTFSLYSVATGGTAAWSETQNVSVDNQGNYSVVLGITQPDGLPESVFSSGGRWLGIQIAGYAESTRTVFTSVPFAFHASSADSLASHVATDYVLVQQLQTAGGLDQIGLTSTINSAITSQLQNQVPLLASANTFAGDQTINGILSLGKTGTASAAGGFNSFPLDLYASAFNSKTAQPETKIFRWQASPSNSNTDNPSARLNLLFGASDQASPVLTGLSINSDGTINFAPQQKLFQFVMADQYPTIQAAITAAGPGGAVFVPPTYTKTDSFVNTNDIPVIDLRSGPNVIDVHDLPGMICDGSADTSGPLNTLFQRSDFTLWNGSISFRRCPYVRLDKQLVIRGQEGLNIDLTGSTLFGCNGAPGPLVLLQRSGNITLEGGNSGAIYAAGGAYPWMTGAQQRCGAGVLSKFNGSIGTDNNVSQGGPSGTTTTANVFRRLLLAPSATTAGIANYCALCTTAAENQEAYIVEENTMSCHGSPGSIGLGLISGNAQSRSLANNKISDCQFGMALWSPFNDVKGNQFGGNGNYDAYPQVNTLTGWWGSRGYWSGNGYGAAIGCWSRGNVIEFNNTFEESGMFIFGRDDAGNTGCDAVLKGNTAGPDYVTHSSTYGQNLHGGLHVPPNAYTIDSTGTITLAGGNTITNCAYNGGSSVCISNGRPVIGSSRPGFDGVGGSQASYVVSAGDVLGPVGFDPLPPTRGFQYDSVSRNVSSTDEILETNFTAYGGKNNPPLKYWWAGNPYGSSSGASDVWAIGIIDPYGAGSPRTTFHIDQIRNDYAGGAGSYVFAQTFSGGISTQAAAPFARVKAQTYGGNTAGSVWGYVLCGQSGGQTWRCSPEVQVNSSATLGGQKNIIFFERPVDYSVVQLWLTTNPGDGRRTGMIAQYTTLNANASCDVHIVQGCQSGSSVYMNDGGQAVITPGTTPTTTADGSMNIPAGACYKKNGTCLTATDFGALPSSTPLPITKAVVGKKWLASYDAATGSFTQTQPSYSDLMNPPQLAQSKTCTSTDKISSYDATTGQFTCSAEQASVAPAIPANIVLIVASGKVALGTSTTTIPAKSCGTPITVAAPGVKTDDVISWSTNGDITSISGFGPADPLFFIVYTAADSVNFKICNGDKETDVVAGVVSLNWRVAR